MDNKVKEEFARLHDAEAVLFKRRYEEFSDNPYASAFAYGRKKIHEITQTALHGQSRAVRLLDVGCGTGFNLCQYQEKGFRCVGVDFSWEMLRVCRLATPHSQVVFGDAEQLPFSPDTFQIVTCIEVIRYLSTPINALQELYRVLRPGGVCVVTAAPRYASHGYALVNCLNSWLRFSNSLKARQSFETTHQLREKMKRAGFRDVQLVACFLGPFRWLEKIARVRLGQILKMYEPLDNRIADFPGFRELSNHFVVWGSK